MEVELSDDEEEIRGRVSSAPKDYQGAFALLVAERLLSSLGHYLPDYWRDAASNAATEGWGCLEIKTADNATFIRHCKKLHAEEIGMNENPVITHVMTTIDRAVEFCEDEAELDELFAEFHHLVGVVEKTAKHPEFVDEAIGGELDYMFSICDAIEKSNRETQPVRSQLLGELTQPSTTLFGTVSE